MYMISLTVDASATRAQYIFLPEYALYDPSEMAARLDAPHALFIDDETPAEL
jgi:hypothetical protein